MTELSDGVIGSLGIENPRFYRTLVGADEARARATATRPVQRISPSV